MAIPKSSDLPSSDFQLSAIAYSIDAALIALLQCSIMYISWLIGMAQGLLDGSSQHWNQLLWCSMFFVLDGYLDCIIPAAAVYMNYIDGWPLRTGTLANQFLAACIIANWMYHAIFESSQSQATPGQTFVGLVVARDSGTPVDFTTATIRHFSRMLASSIFGLGLLPIWGTKRQPLHDLLSRSALKRDNTR